jgi:hypothetical protein
VATTARPSRPAPVKVAVGLMSGLFIAAAARNAVLGSHSHSLIVAILVQAAIVTVLLTAIALGQRWAVMVYVVLFVLGLPLLLLSAVHDNAAGLVWTIAGTAVELVAIGLLFSRPARAWFAVVRDERVAFDPNTGRSLLP